MSKFMSMLYHHQLIDDITLGYLCNEGEELITNSMPESVSMIVANDLLAERNEEKPILKKGID